MASKQGLLDLEVHDHDLVFGTHINRALTKAQRLVYGDSEMNHAMVITGVHLVSFLVVGGVSLFPNITFPLFSH